MKLRPDIAQHTPEWHAWRAQGVTATDAVLLAGFWGGTEEARARKMDGLALLTDIENYPMRRGTALEPVARARAEDVLCATLTPGCGEYDADPLLRASFDGIGTDFDGREDGVIVEIKCPLGMKNHEAGIIPPHHEPQLLHEATVADVEQILYVSYHPTCYPPLKVIPSRRFPLALRQQHAARMRAWWDHIQDGGTDETPATV